MHKTRSIILLTDQSDGEKYTMQDESKSMHMDSYNLTCSNLTCSMIVALYNIIIYFDHTLSPSGASAIWDSTLTSLTTLTSVVLLPVVLGVGLCIALCIIFSTPVILLSISGCHILCYFMPSLGAKAHALISRAEFLLLSPAAEQHPGVKQETIETCKKNNQTVWLVNES